MTTAEPRSWLIASQFFGTRIDARWRRYLKAEELDVALAYLQHQMACAVRGALGNSGRTHGDFATCLGDNVDTVRKKLKGEVRMTLEDVLKWARELGVDVIPFPQGWSEMLPPENLVGA